MKKGKRVYIVTANGPGTLGGPMGTEHEGPTEFRRVCLDVKSAKKAAQDYFDKKCDEAKAEREPISWGTPQSSGYRSADMSWLLFHISPEVVA